MPTFRRVTITSILVAVVLVIILVVYVVLFHDSKDGWCNCVCFIVDQIYPVRNNAFVWVIWTFILFPYSAAVTAAIEMPKKYFQQTTKYVIFTAASITFFFKGFSDSSYRFPVLFILIKPKARDAAKPPTILLKISTDKKEKKDWIVAELI